MRRWIALAARLYPRSWRDRYGEEFDALLDDATADWRQFLNVAHVALTMQLENGIAHLKVAGALALAGSILAMAASYRVPPRYVASALLQVTPVLDAAQPAAKDVVGHEAEDRVETFRKGFGRHAIAQIARNLDLYRAERERTSLEDVMDRILDDGDIQIRPVEVPGRNGAAPPAAFRVSFAYPDKEKAQAAVGELVTLLRQENAFIEQSKALGWKALWSQPIPFQDRLDVVEPARLPARLTQPRREVFLACGAAGGLLLGVLAILFRRHPAAGLRVAACALAGTALAAAVSFLIPEQYRANAVLRITAPFDPQHFSGAVPETPVRDRVERLKSEILGPGGMGKTLESAGRLMTADDRRKLRARDIDIHMLEPTPAGVAASSFEVAFTHRDKNIARMAVMAVVSRLQIQDMNDAASMAGKESEVIEKARRHGAGENLEIVSSPKAADQPATHFRLAVTLAGALLGILLGGVLSRGKTRHGSAQRVMPAALRAVNP